MCYLCWKIFDYFQKELNKRDETIKSMTSVLVETSEVMTRLTTTVSIQKSEYFSELKIRAEEIKAHISNLFLNKKN
jgi:tRNA U54 and U55 pseudouridine synthase Pus10